MENKDRIQFLLDTMDLSGSRMDPSTMKKVHTQGKHQMRRTCFADGVDESNIKHGNVETQPDFQRMHEIEQSLATVTAMSSTTPPVNQSSNERHLSIRSRNQKKHEHSNTAISYQYEEDAEPSIKTSPLRKRIEHSQEHLEKGILILSNSLKELDCDFSSTNMPATEIDSSEQERRDRLSLSNVYKAQSERFEDDEFQVIFQQSNGKFMEVASPHIFSTQGAASSHLETLITDQAYELSASKVKLTTPMLTKKKKKTTSNEKLMTPIFIKKKSKTKKRKPDNILKLESTDYVDATVDNQFDKSMLHLGSTVYSDFMAFPSTLHLDHSVATGVDTFQHFSYFHDDNVLVQASNEDNISSIPELSRRVSLQEGNLGSTHHTSQSETSAWSGRVSAYSLPIERVTAPIPSLSTNFHFSAPTPIGYHSEWAGFDIEHSTISATKWRQDNVYSSNPILSSNEPSQVDTRSASLNRNVLVSAVADGGRDRRIRTKESTFPISKMPSDVSEKIFSMYTGSGYNEYDMEKNHGFMDNVDRRVSVSDCPSVDPQSCIGKQDRHNWLPMKNSKEKHRCWKSKWAMILSLIFFGTAVTLGLYFGLTSTSTLENLESEPCDVGDISQQCDEWGKISLLPSCVRGRYDELKANFILNLDPSFDEEDDSCERGNLALIGLASSLKGDETTKYQENSYLLRLFFIDTDGMAWIKSDLWMTGNSYCSWLGVTCNQDLDVIELHLDFNNVAGALPTEIGLFSNLQIASLALNALGGTIPSELGMISPLGALNLNSNLLGGTLPTDIGMLRALRKFDASSNSLIGPIPSSIGQLSSILSLQLNHNMLTGHIPSDVALCENLAILLLSSNKLSQTLPTELGTLPSIQVLDLENNLFFGSSIPSELGRLSNLVVLKINNSYLNGTLPTELGNMLSLTSLHLGSGTLSGTIPAELCKLTDLKDLHLNFNGLMGTLPTHLGLMQRIEDLDISYNALSGTLPSELGLLSDLRTLLLLGNTLTGVVPSELCSLQQHSDVGGHDFDTFRADYCDGDLLSCGSSGSDPMCCQGCP